MDTSSLMKLYAEEEGSQHTRSLVAQADVVNTSIISYVEMRAALARKQRTGEIAAQEYNHLLGDFERDWPLYASIPVTRGLISSAGTLAERHGLRALDALHLASATGLAGRVSESVVFLCADANLTEAATQEGLSTSTF